MSHSHPQLLTLKQQFCGIFGFSATGAIVMQYFGKSEGSGGCGQAAHPHRDGRHCTVRRK